MGRAAARGAAGKPGQTGRLDHLRLWGALPVESGLCRAAGYRGGRDHMNLTGIHHLTAISADIRGNHQFYTKVLGLRLVKRSVNQDDVSAYHLFYADAKGSPGTDITFFDWAMPRERRGTHAIVRTHMRVNGTASLDWWAAHLSAQNVKHDGVAEVDG